MSQIHETQDHVNTETCFSFVPSYIRFPGDDAPPWIRTPLATFILIPPPPEPDRATCYGASLVADDLLEDLREL